MEQREKGDAQRRIGELDAVERRARGRISGIFDVADHHAGRDVLRGGPVDDHLGAAVVHVVVGRDDRDARALQPHLHVAPRRGHDGPDAIEHLARGGDHHHGVPVLELRHRLFADVARHHQPIGAVLTDLRALLVGDREHGKLLAVLLDDDPEILDVRAGRLHFDFERGGDPDELFRLVDLDGRAGHPSTGDVGASGGEHQDQHQSEEKTHP